MFQCQRLHWDFATHQLHLKNAWQNPAAFNLMRASFYPKPLEFIANWRIRPEFCRSLFWRGNPVECKHHLKVERGHWNCWRFGTSDAPANEVQKLQDTLSSPSQEEKEIFQALKFCCENDKLKTLQFSLGIFKRLLVGFRCLTHNTYSLCASMSLLASVPEVPGSTPNIIFALSLWGLHWILNKPHLFKKMT